MKDKKLQLIFHSLLVFVLMQPFFDILSNLYIEGILKIGISTYIKPIFVSIIAIYLFIKYCTTKKSWLLYGILLFMFIIGHTLVLKNLYIESNIITKEIRTIISVVYMIILFFDFNILYKLSINKKEYLINLKKTIAITFLIYAILLIISVLTGTSGFTYEYSDTFKQGFKGWLDSGQIFGHALSIMFPILLYTILKPRFKWYLRIIFIIPIIISAILIGTRVPFYIILIVLVLYLIISIYNKIFNKYYKLNLFNLCFVIICMTGLILIYPYTPLYNNTKINMENLNTDISLYDKEKITAHETIEYYNNIIDNNENVSEVKKYNSWIIKSSDNLLDLYERKIVHPSDLRTKQFHYSKNIFKLSSLKYKLFGTGYLNQFDGLQLETDIFMTLFCFGILGFILLLFIPIKEFIKDTIYMLKNIKTNDLETYLLYASFGMFFCISMYAGATFIYTNFSIFLIILLMMLKCKIDINEEYKRKSIEVKKITFLMLHLGYGGIETATINTANALSKKYDVELISFYKLNNNQCNKINKKINVKFLYNGGPNKEEILNALKNKKIFSIIKEGIKSVDILIKRSLLVIKEIKKSKSDVIISTRVEFTPLLSKYGSSKILKIAQEHYHHNNNKKYINKIKYKYDNINYLCALTNTLKEDYEKFLTNNVTTKVVLMPNMIKSNFKKFTNLKNNNIIFIGRLHELKRVNELVKMFSKIKKEDYTFYIIGDGEEYSNIKNLISDLNLDNNVKMLGYLNQQEIEKYLLKSKVFCMASTTEGLPMVLLEVMSYGVPCIAYNTESGIKDIIDNGENGYIIYNRNEDEYIEKLNKMMLDSKLLSNMSENAIKKAKSFEETEMLRKWECVLNQEI